MAFQTFNECEFAKLQPRAETLVTILSRRQSRRALSVPARLIALSQSAMKNLYFDGEPSNGLIKVNKSLYLSGLFSLRDILLGLVTLVLGADGLFFCLSGGGV